MKKIKTLHYPKPRKLFEELELEEVDKYRKLDCIFYEICLDHAVEFNYRSFYCMDNCLYYKKTTMNLLEKEAFDEMAKVILKELNKKDE